MTHNAGHTRARALGAALRREREKVRPELSLRAFAAQLGKSPSVLSRWENGQQPPTPEQTAALLGRLGVFGDEQERLLGMARAAHDPTWVEPGQSKLLAALRDFESDAIRITDVQPSLIPGLLQSPEYTRTIMLAESPTMTYAQIERAVDTRMGRQRILFERQVELVALIGVHAFHRKLGGVEVMTAQLRHIRKMSELPNVTVCAIPDGETPDPSIAGAFTLLEFEAATPVVHFEHYRSSMFLPDKRDIEDMRVAAEEIRKIAMSPEYTSELIAEQIATHMKTEHQ